MVVMTTEENGLTAVSGWTDDEIRADNVRAAGVLYAAAAYEELKLIELAEHLNELNQQKLLNVGAGEASNLLHVFWDKGYKRMPARRRLAVLARVIGAPGAAEDAEVNGAFADLFEDLVTAVAGGSAESLVAAATALHENLAAHTDEDTTKAAMQLRDTITELGTVLSDLELRTAFRGAEDMWQLVERFQEENGGGPDVQRVRALASNGTVILHALPELAGGEAASDEVVAAAKQWLPANSTAA
jgi:hypothetical protein